MKLKNPEALRIIENLEPIPSDMIDSYVKIMTVCARYLTLSNALPGTRPSITESAIAYIKENVGKRITVKSYASGQGAQKPRLLPLLNGISERLLPRLSTRKS